MLPDYPALKRELAETLNIIFRRLVYQHTIAVREVPKSRIFEGDKHVIMKRSTGEEDPITFFSAETILEIGVDEAPTLTLQEMLNSLSKAALDMAGKMEKGFFESLSEYLKKAGRSIDGKQQPFSAERFLEALESMWISFDDQGNPEFPTLYINPNLEETVKKVFKDIEGNRELKRKSDEVMFRKREEWRAREASRKLVG